MKSMQRLMSVISSCNVKSQARLHSYSLSREKQLIFASFQVRSPSSSPSKPLLRESRTGNKDNNRPVSSFTADTDVSESYRILHSEWNRAFREPNAK